MACRLWSPFIGDLLHFAKANGGALSKAYFARKVEIGTERNVKRQLFDVVAVFEGLHVYGAHVHLQDFFIQVYIQAFGQMKKVPPNQFVKYLDFFRESSSTLP